MMRQKLAFVVTGSTSLTLKRMNGFSPVKITWFGSAGIGVTSLENSRAKIILTYSPRKDDGMTKIILVRHGHVEGISPERFRGRADLALTTEGRRQADATARRIHAGWAPAAIYTSPLSRARGTGEAIGKPFGLSPSLLDGLVDIDYGQWQGLTPDEVRARWPALLDTWYRAPDWAAIPGGETLQELAARAVSALREVMRRHPQDTV